MEWGDTGRMGSKRLFGGNYNLYSVISIMGVHGETDPDNWLSYFKAAEWEVQLQTSRSNIDRLAAQQMPR